MKEISLKKKSNTVDQRSLLKPEILSNVNETLTTTHPDLLIRGMMDYKAREELKRFVIKEHAHVHKHNEEVIDYIVQETVGTGVMEQILQDESITDIGYNGKDLVIESNDSKFRYEGSTDVTEDYIIRLIQKFAFANKKDFTPKNPIFDGTFENMRISAMHQKNTVTGTTMSLRIVRPRLALTKENFSQFAPEYIYELFNSVTNLKTNIIISGETGTGKTELQKLMASFIPFKQRIVLIEEVAETFLKEMFPEKDIYSWLTTPDVSISDLVKSALRNNPRWIIVSETRSQEAYEMIQAVLSGHHIITTLHAVNARAIPKRLINMAKMGYSVSEEALEGDIRRYCDLGIHINRTEIDNKVIRYLAEIVEFNETEDKTIFKQRYVDGKFICETGELSKDLKDRLESDGIQLTFPENHNHTRSARPSGYLTKIPVMKE